MDYKRVLLLHFTNGMSSREIAEVTGAGKTTVNEFLKRFRECQELSYPLPEDATNEFVLTCTGILTPKKFIGLWPRRAKRSSICGKSIMRQVR